jgi:hypothetical protein
MIMARNATNDNYEKAVAASTGPFVVALKAAAATDPRCEVLMKQGVPVTLQVATGATLKPHDFVKVDDNNKLVPFALVTDKVDSCVGQYNQHGSTFGTATVALPDGAADDIVYIDLGVVPLQDKVT